MSSDPNAETADYPAGPAPTAPPKQLPAAVPARVDLSGLTDRGKVRANNEDVFLIARLERALHPVLSNLPADIFPDRLDEVAHAMLVADGIGGAAAGEVASRQAASTLIDLVLGTPDWIMRLDEQEEDRFLQRFAWRYREIDIALKTRSRTDPSLAGMGTTLTVACTLGTNLLVSHVGDSRAYLFREGQLHQLTRDHTYAQVLADRGHIRPEQVATHPLRRVLTQALGGDGPPAEADLLSAVLADGDQVLLCTDGLTDMVADARIAAILDKAGTAQEGCEALVAAALDRGGKDNVTVTLARYCFGDAVAGAEGR